MLVLRVAIHHYSNPGLVLYYAYYFVLQIAQRGGNQFGRGGGGGGGGAGNKR